MNKLAPYVRILGRGPGRSRSLTEEEAFEAFTLILQGDAAPEAVGALLMLMRFRGEIAPEIAGFVRALRAHVDADWTNVPAGLDWPTYAAGRTRGLPFYLLSAKLIAASGTPVLLHGWNSHQNPVASVRDQLSAVEIPVAKTAEAATKALKNGGIAYVPLEEIAPDAFRILKLRDVLGLRSAVNTTLRVFNPSLAPASVQGVFHPSYRELQADAGALLGLARLTVIKGGGGEFERHPSKDIAGFGLRDTNPWTGTAPALLDETRRLATKESQPEDLANLWNGTHSDEFAEAVVIGTAGLALLTTGQADSIEAADEQARALWAARHSTK
ncbi:MULTISPECIES: glycosyl transferase family protein [Halocynthiibacter]|uniref:Glycosyl transferase family protein n=1 Tax=Halocynthiibacter halioticoli TaxID=2986804 RepID=A0AAE3IXI4_9RHOB|nr:MULTISPECIES: glycosyl transferase family protein [Halocynthiibacter]MCV6823549.1 glycosyl transferase family protein [Halocynthiibacter halioticoli]MCW4056550.1 glycosyl transferase family protein [Halocynthiibacter sp. SDUM655004]